MRTITTGSGILVNLVRGDKRIIENNGVLEGLVIGTNNVVLRLHVVKNNPPQDLFEERGFHIEAKPRYGGIENRERYDIYLSEERFSKLTAKPTFDKMVNTFTSRSFYDRIELIYFEP